MCAVFIYSFILPFILSLTSSFIQSYIYSFVHSSIQSFIYSFIYLFISFSLQQASYESCKSLGSWSRDLIQRVDFFSEWADRTVSVGERILKASQSGLHKAASMSSSGLAVTGEDLPGRPASARPTDMFPRSYWLPAFVFPQGESRTFSANRRREVLANVCDTGPTLTLSSLNLPLSSSSITSHEFLSQFPTCSGWRWCFGAPWGLKGF